MITGTDHGKGRACPDAMDAPDAPSGPAGKTPVDWPEAPAAGEKKYAPFSPATRRP